MTRRNSLFYFGRSAITFTLGALAAAAYAQGGQATLSGTVTDPTGALIPGAHATLVDEATKVQRSVVADKNGMVVFVSVPPDTYDVLVTAPGFWPARENRHQRNR
jgi:protocatechuate 3,4-dioxygenase beta subunit